MVKKMTAPETSLKSSLTPLADTQLDQFDRDGFLILRGFAEANSCKKMRGVITVSLNPPLAPVEFETEVHYPGAPENRQSPGGDTSRRLLHAVTRDQVFREWASSPMLVAVLQQLLRSKNVMVSQNHHNCIMTKHPGYSSATNWHQDIRYWTFDKPELISVWLALNDEYPENGGMLLLPGTHNLELDRGRYDAAYFLRTDLDENKMLIDSAQAANLKTGDVLFFHSRTFHAAGQNNTQNVKTSLVFTYRDADNKPIKNTRSAQYPDIPV